MCGDATWVLGQNVLEVQRQRGRSDADENGDKEALKDARGDWALFETENHVAYGYAGYGRLVCAVCLPAIEVEDLGIRLAVDGLNLLEKCCGVAALEKRRVEGVGGPVLNEDIDNFVNIVRLLRVGKAAETNWP